MGHNAMVKELQMLYQMNSEIFIASEGGSSIAVIDLFTQADNKALAMNNLLHSADVSNPCRTWDCCQPWAMKVLEEFFAQGDQEKELGIPVQFLNDRDKLNRPNSQIGFVEFVIAPYYAAQIRLWPMMSEYGEALSNNLAAWEELWAEEVKPGEEERVKVAGRVQRVKESMEDAVARRPLATN